MRAVAKPHRAAKPDRDRAAGMIPQTVVAAAAAARAKAEQRFPTCLRREVVAVRVVLFRELVVLIGLYGAEMTEIGCGERRKTRFQGKWNRVKRSK